MSRDYAPVLLKEDLESMLEDLQAEAEMRRTTLGDSVSAQLAYALATVRIEALDSVYSSILEAVSFKVLKENLEEDDENYYRTVDKL